MGQADPAQTTLTLAYVRPWEKNVTPTPQNTFTVSVTISWKVTWAGAGQGGTIPGLTTTGAVPVRVTESQAVISG